jgi:MFS family permease
MSIARAPVAEAPSPPLANLLDGRGRLALLTVGSLPVMAGAIIAPSLPSMREHFHDVENVDVLVRLLIALPSVVIALTAPISGYIADKLGRKQLLYVSLTLFLVGGTTGIYVDDLTLLLVGRLVLGAGMGGLMTAVTALVADFFTGSERQRFLGLQAAFMSLSAVVFLLAGGAVANITWRGPFFAYLAPLAMLPLVVFFIPQPPAIAPPKAGAPLEVLPRALIAVLFFIAHVGMNVFYLMPVHVPFLLSEHLSTNAFVAGGVIASTTFASAIAALSFGRLRARFSSSTLLFAVFAIASPGLFIVGNATSLPFVFAGAFLAGLGFGLQMPVLTTWISEVTPAGMRGRVLGGFSAAVFLGQFMSPLVTSPLVQVQGLAGPTGLFAIGALFSFVFAFAVLFVTRALAKR